MRRLLTVERVTALAIIVLGAWFIWQATELRQGPGYAAVGPRVFPTIVGCGLLGSGLALLLTARGRDGTAVAGAPDDGDGTVAADWRTLLGIAALLAAYVLLFHRIGFVIASALFLAGGAWTLGSRTPLRDLLIGLLLSLLVYAVFTQLLTLDVPAGPIEGPLDALLDRAFPRV